MNVFSALLKNKIYAMLLHPGIWIAALIFSVSTSFFFFYFSHLFIIDACFINLPSFFSFISYISIILIPAVCLAVEQSGDFFEQCLPVSQFQIAAANWITSLIVFFGMLILTVHIPIFSSRYTDISLPSCFTAFWGLLLFSGVSLAFCQFVFVCSRNNIIAFAATALFLAVINLLHFLPLYAVLPEPISFLCRQLSFAWHFDSASKGILDSRDCIFYIAASAIWLSLCVYAREIKLYGFSLPLFSPANLKKHSELCLLNKAVLLCAVSALCLVLNSRHIFFKIDMSFGRQYSVSEHTKQIMDNIAGTLRITYYKSNILESVYPQTKMLTDFLQTFAASMPAGKCSFRIVFPDNDEQLKKNLESAGITGQTIRSAENNKVSYSTVYSAVAIEYLGKTEYIPFVLDSANIEYLLSLRLQSLLGKEISVQILASSDIFSADYPYLEPYLNMSGIHIIFTDSSNIDASLPLVLLKTDTMTEYDISALEQFVMSGGNMLAAVSPYTADIHGSWNISAADNKQLLQLFDFWGISFGRSIVADEKCSKIVMQSENTLNNTQYVPYPFWVAADYANVPPDAESHPLTASFHGLELFWPVPITLYAQPNAAYKKLIVSSPDSVLIAPAEAENDAAGNLFDINPFSVSGGIAGNNRRGPFTLAAAVQGSVPGLFSAGSSAPVRMIFISDPRIVSSIVGYTGSLHNFGFFESCLLWLSENDGLLAVKNRPRINALPHKLSSMPEQYMLIAHTWAVFCFIGIPLFLAAVFFAINIADKKKKK
ncbi:MAG: GldG family protein [Bacteroides sp.]|nr:GldG family protein [Prevotella sp.]MCM1407911.1 GldG family protein [Treponema brennaborense]MCM1469653.1 GldG family protein [Bacteroides sp.]